MYKLKNYHYGDSLECRLKYTKTVHNTKKLLYSLATITFNNVKCNTTSQM
jgi:hypothetical protein